MTARHEVIMQDGEPVILIRSMLRVEVHDLDGSTIEARDPTEAEKVEHAAWEQANPRGSRRARLIDPRRAEPPTRLSTGRHIL